MAEFHGGDDGPAKGRDFEIAAAPSGEKPGEFLFVLFIRDVSRRKAMESELVRADRLATIGRMAAGVAHEINNPLFIMRADAEVMLDRGLCLDQGREFLESIQRNTRRAEGITRQLLQLARPDEPRRSLCALREAVAGTVDKLKAHLGRVEVELDRDGEPLPVLADPGKLDQVFTNILLNALKATEDTAQPRVAISFQRNGSACAVSFEDNGCGIREEDLGRVFDPFFTTSRERGFGLGLYVAKLIIEDHGGSILARSTYGEGTVMTIELPLCQNEEHAGGNPPGELHEH